MLAPFQLIEAYNQTNDYIAHKYKRIKPQSRLCEKDVLQGLSPVFHNRYFKNLQSLQV